MMTMVLFIALRKARDCAFGFSQREVCDDCGLNYLDYAAIFSIYHS